MNYLLQITKPALNSLRESSNVKSAKEGETAGGAEVFADGVESDWGFGMVECWNSGIME